MRRNFLYHPKLKALARSMRNEMTIAEKKLWYEYLNQHKYKWLRQKPIRNYILDFYCAKLKLAIELDGETHLENKDIIYDQNRTNELGKMGIKVLRFWNFDVIEGLGEVEEIIEKEIKNREREIGRVSLHKFEP